MMEPERVLFERMVAYHVPYVLVRLVTATCFGPPYDDHVRALVGAHNAPVSGTAGQWVLYLGDFNPWGYVLGPADGWADILKQALEVIEAGDAVQVPMTKEELGIFPKPEEPKVVPVAVAMAKKKKWGALWK